MSKFQHEKVEKEFIDKEYNGTESKFKDNLEDLKCDYSSIDQYVGQKLRDFRVKVGLTLKDCSERVGISHQQIHKYESGQTKIPSGMLYKFSKLFLITPNSFFEGYRGAKTDVNQSKLDITTYPRADTINILLVDHNSEDQYQIMQCLEGFSHRANLYSVHDGQEFINIIKQRSTISKIPIPDIILFDLDVPKMEGISLLKYIKQDKDLKHIPVLVITASINIKDVMDCYKSYASGYIRKSFDIEVLKKHMQFALNYWINAVVLPHHEWNE